MTGYPHAVLKLYKENDRRTLTERVYENDRHEWRDREPYQVTSQALGGSLSGAGVLPHLAIAVNDPEMLRLLFKLSKHPQYRRDRKLRFQNVVRCAVVFNSVGMLECIYELKTQDHTWRTREPKFMRIALVHKDPGLQVLDWLYTHLPTKEYPLVAKYMQHQAKRGDFGLVQWLHERTPKISQKAMDEAAKGGHIDMLRCFYAHSGRRCTSAALELAAWKSFLDVVKFTIENRKREEPLRFAIDNAAGAGHFEAVRYLIEKKVSFRPRAVQTAAHNGHLGITKYLLEIDSDCSTIEAMTSAASSGHLDTVKFLHGNRTDGCNVRTH